MIVCPESPVRNMTSQVALGQTKYSKAHVAFLGLYLKMSKKIVKKQKKSFVSIAV